MDKLKSILYTTFMVLACAPLLSGLVITILLSFIVFIIAHRSVKRGFKNAVSMYKDITSALW